MDQNHRTFLYNGHGHALSGHIVRPFEQHIEVQAGMSLPTSGGYGSVRAENFRFKEVVSFKAAYTQVSGSMKKEDNSHTTLVSSTIEGLNILDMVTADRIVARLASNHLPGHGESRIILLGSHFENLRIAGCPIHVELDHELFLKMDTFEAVRNEFQSNAEFRRMAEDLYGTGKPQALPDSHGVVHCSLVKEMKTTCPGIKRQGHVFTIPQFGKIFLAEVIAEHSKRTLTMLRLELGSPTCGTVDAADVQANGRPLPPAPGSSGT